MQRNLGCFSFHFSDNTDAEQGIIWSYPAIDGLLVNLIEDSRIQWYMNVGNHSQVELQPGVQIINVSAISLGENISFQPSNTTLTTQNTGGRLTIELDPVI